jgi:hypothetical protein
MTSKTLVFIKELERAASIATIWRLISGTDTG